mmetsp:Transcript_20973/g.32506  ORF Transcript_20973/g.32506 Transcript_20973/m.32506 type:complete len:180 (+) Transcript_20973:3992-4531(+)
MDNMNISPEPTEEFEMRFVVWRTKDIENMDWEGCSDIFVRVFLDPDNDRLTDTHWRCQNGKGSFNYRLLIPVKSKEPEYILTIQGWDKDIIASNDLIGECNIDITTLVEDCVLTKRQMALTQKYWDEWMKEQILASSSDFSQIANDITWEEKDKFWVPIRKMNHESQVVVGTGEILCSL